MAQSRLRFGAFIPPHTPPDENPILALEHDMDLVEWLDKLNYDEAWIGEHHSGGWETIGHPDVFLAAARSIDAGFEGFAAVGARHLFLSQHVFKSTMRRRPVWRRPGPAREWPGGG